MEQLKDKISDLINEYFDKKIEDVNWRYDLTAKEKAERLIRECISDVLYSLEDCNNCLDEHLEEFETSYEEPSQYWEDYNADCYYRTRDLIDERR
jgi:hypothetical protein